MSRGVRNVRLRASHAGVGEKHYAARLSWADVRMIRHRVSCEACQPGSSYSIMAAEYRVTPPMLTHIKNERSWHPSHDPDPQPVECPLPPPTEGA